MSHEILLSVFPDNIWQRRSGARQDEPGNGSGVMLGFFSDVYTVTLLYRAADAELIRVFSNGNFYL